MSQRVARPPNSRIPDFTPSRKDALALLSLVVMALIVFWRLAWTDLIIGRGDIFFYFYPYRDFASAAARAGRVPLWNPYLFMGAPFLANSQAGFFYPFNLALAWLPVERMVNASIVIHAGLAAVGAYLWGRGGLGLGRPAAWLSGLCYGLGGYFLAQVEHLNQIQVLAWLPWLLWIYVLRNTYYVIRIAGLALVIGLQFLAGHVQSVFICLVGLAGYVLLPPAWEVLRRRVVWRSLIEPFFVVAGAVGLGGALAAVQLLPTFELSQLSIRSGGLPYKEVVSFSLRPELVGRALLPAWSAPLFPEFVAYVGVVGLGLAVLGVWVGWFDGLLFERVGERPLASASLSLSSRNTRRGAVLLAALGLLLALGGFNPLYFVLVKLVPGFDLFRAPARWLALYAVGVAGLVGMGWEGLSTVKKDQADQRARFWISLVVAGVLLAGLVLLGQFLDSTPALNDAAQGEPTLTPPLDRYSVAGWLAATIAFITLVHFYAIRNTHYAIRITHYAIYSLVIVELLAASLFLPFNRATAPGALMSLRPAVAHLLAEVEAEARASAADPPARFLSISDIFFDPGDKPEIEIALGPLLSDDALYDYVIATKQKEVLIPNLPLYYRLPAMDGYDGGVLPLRYFVTLERLYMPAEQVALDGRLRENLARVPDGRWLGLFNVRFVLTDKVGDAWFDGVFYDLQMGADLGAGDEVAVAHVSPLAATALGLVYRANGVSEDTLLAEVDVTFANGRRASLPLRAGAAGEGDRVARLSWGWVGTPAAVRVRGLWEAGAVKIRGVSLIDERTGVFQALVLSDSGRFRLAHSGDVKIYENLDVRPRISFVSRAVAAPDDEAALEIMRAPNFDPTTTIVLATSQSPVPNPQSPIPNLPPKTLLYTPEHIVATVNAPTAGWLLLSDAWYPGWKATVDGQPSPVLRANVLFRAVRVPAGEHRVEWVYRPDSYRWGVAISIGALVLLLLLGGVGLGLHRFRRWEVFFQFFAGRQ